MYNPNKKYGYIQKNKSSSKNKNQMNEPFSNVLQERDPNLDLQNNQKIKNMEDNIYENQNNENDEFYNSDIDDPKYRPKNLAYDNNKKDIDDYNINKISNEYNNLDYNNKDINFMGNSRYHNFENIESLNIPKDNFYQNKTMLDLQNENELLKQEILKKSETIRSKDELITEFQNIYNDLKIRFEQYELKNNQMRQHIKYLEAQIQNNQNLSKTQSNLIQNQEMNEKTISLFKQQISELESDYNTKSKKLVEKFKDKENKIKQDHMEEVARLNKNIEIMRLENAKLKTEISNNKVELDSLKAKIESKDYEKTTYLDQKEKEILKLKEKISEQNQEMEFKEKELKQRISKLEDQISLMKQENNNLLNTISEIREKSNEYDTEISNHKNISNRLNNELNQVNLSLKNKDAIIEQLKSQIEELNDLIVQSEEDLKLFEENKQQEFGELSNQIEILIQEKNVLKVQNMELTENLSLANENMKELNEIISNKYANVEAELFKQTNKKENLEKKYKDIFKHMKNKQNLLNEENNKLKEIINKQEGQMDNFGDSDIKMNNIQNLNLYKKINGDDNENNLNHLNFETNIPTNLPTNRSSKNNNNLINIHENYEQTFGNNNLNINTPSYIDTKEERQKRTLNNFRMLVDKMDEKIEIQ